MAIIGIDLGTTNSLVCVWKNGKIKLIENSFGEIMTPSAVSLDGEDVFVGKIAKERSVTNPEQTATSFKQFMGTEKIFNLGKKKFKAEDLSALVIGKLKDDAELFLGETVTEAIISVPAYFDDNQRSATQLAGELAGLKVERIINEPSAAALAYQYQNDKSGMYLVFDFGGGTLDISVVDIFDNIINIIAIAGDNHLGGDDINHTISEYFLSQHPELDGKLSESEKMSLDLVSDQVKRIAANEPLRLMSINHKGETYSEGITNELLIEICAPILNKIKSVLKRVLQDSNKNINEIDDIIMIGGSSRMVIIKQYIKHITKMEPLTDIDPDLAVAKGIGVAAGIKMRDENIKDMILMDVCPFTLGVDVISHDYDSRLKMSPIISRNSELPISRANHYSTIRDNQEVIKFGIYQGENRIAEDNLKIGSLKVEIPPMPAGGVTVLVRFSYDINGILQVEVVDENDEIIGETVIIRNNKMSEEDIANKIKELEKLKKPIYEEEGVKHLLSRADRLYAESLDFHKEIIDMNINNFRIILQTGHSAEIKKSCEDFRQFLDNIEETLYGDVGLE